MKTVPPCVFVLFPYGPFKGTNFFRRCLNFFPTSRFLEIPNGSKCVSLLASDQQKRYPFNKTDPTQKSDLKAHSKMSITIQGSHEGKMH